MKKLIVTAIVMFIAFPIMTMNIMNLQGNEEAVFIQTLSKKVDLGKQMIEQKTILEDNHIYIMHNNLLHKFTVDKCSLLKIIKDYELKDCICKVADTIEDMDDVQELRRQIFEQLTEEDYLPSEEITQKLSDLRQKLFDFRWEYSEILLNYLQPDYLIADKKEEIVDFMIKNRNYPIDERAEKDYVAFFIYKNILAQRNPFDLSYLFSLGNLKTMDNL